MFAGSLTGGAADDAPAGPGQQNPSHSARCSYTLETLPGAAVAVGDMIAVPPTAGAPRLAAPIDPAARHGQLPAP